MSVLKIHRGGILCWLILKETIPLAYLPASTGAQQHAGKDHYLLAAVLFKVLPCICCSQVLVPTLSL